MIPIPVGSKYEGWIKWLREEKGSDSLTANELTRLYPHFVMALRKPKLKVEPGGREELFKLLNSGNVQTVLSLAEL